MHEKQIIFKESVHGMCEEMSREPCNENSWMVQSIRVLREEKR